MPKNTRSNHHKKCLVKSGTKKSFNGLKKRHILKRDKASTAVKKGHKPMCISKAKHKAGKMQAKRRKSWITACQKAKKLLNITGFVAIKKGTPLYNLAKKLHRAAQTKPGTVTSIMNKMKSSSSSKPIASRTRARTKKKMKSASPIAHRTRAALRRKRKK